jgi:hypothetical protein
MTRTRLWAVLVAGVVAADGGAAPPPAELAVPPQDLARARELVQLLGNPSYQVREDASAGLGKMGRLARSALLDAVAGSSDAEVRARAARLLPRAEAADLQARIDAFVADAEGRYDHDLPAWEAFRTQAGADRGARGLFAEMLRGPDNREVLVAIAAGPERGGAAVSNRRWALYMAQNPGAFGGARLGGPMPTARQPTLVDIATLLFGETAVPAADIPRPGQFTFLNGAFFAQQAASVQAARDPTGVPHGEAYKQLVARWLDTRVSPDDLGQVVHVAQQLSGVRDVTPLLRRVVTTAGVQGYARGQALVYLLQRNKKAEHPFLKEQLKNDGPVAQVYLGANPMGGAIQASCQVRDVALALLVADSGQSILDYGFTTAPGNTPAPLIHPSPTYAFLTDEARNQAMRKWAEWEAHNPTGKQPEPKR